MNQNNIRTINILIKLFHQSDEIYFSKRPYNQKKHLPSEAIRTSTSVTPSWICISTSLARQLLWACITAVYYVHQSNIVE